MKKISEIICGKHSTVQLTVNLVFPSLTTMIYGSNSQRDASLWKRQESPRRTAFDNDTNRGSNWIARPPFGVRQARHTARQLQSAWKHEGLQRHPSISSTYWWGTELWFQHFCWEWLNVRVWKIEHHSLKAQLDWWFLLARWSVLLIKESSNFYSWAIQDYPIVNQNSAYLSYAGDFDYFWMRCAM